MRWSFERIAGPFQGATGGLAWDGAGMLFSAIEEGLILRYDPASGAVSEWRRYTNRVNGIAFAPDGTLFGGQEGGRRVIQFMPDGSARPTATRIAGRLHNFPCDLAIDRRGRVWFTDPYHTVLAYGPQLFPPLDHASVLRLERDERNHWTIVRVTNDTAAPRALALSADERTLYVAEGEPGRPGPRELRAYPVEADGSVGPPVVVMTFGADHRGPHRGIEGLCLDDGGDLVAVGGWRKSGPGPFAMAFDPQGMVLESHLLPFDAPIRCAFGDADLDSLYVTTAGGEVYRARATGRRGARRR